ncbi:MAG: T9SS type A sorting domain-containing protein [candidate division WOR-3 bacterium]|nr:MAG: T9SS type A sorting domain-containing protein [candidate division WOR-3 bacterium]
MDSCSYNGIWYQGSGLVQVSLLRNTILGTSPVGSSRGIHCYHIATGSSIHGNVVRRFNYGLSLWDTPARVEFNTVDSNWCGVVCDFAPLPVVNFNNISGNTPIGLLNDASSDTVDARYNWWGSSSGPRTDRNPGGTGDSVSLNVDFADWLLHPLSRGPDVGPLAVLAPMGIVAYDSVIAPLSTVLNSGAETASFWTRMTIGSAYAESVSTTLAPGEIDTLVFPVWQARPKWLQAVRCSTMYESDSFPANDMKTTAVIVDSGLQPLVADVSPDTAPNTAPTIVEILGRRFVPGVTARLRRAGQPDIVADSANIQFISSEEIWATFDLTGAAAGLWSLSVRNPNGDTSCFPVAFGVVNFLGRVITFGQWEDFGVSANDSVEFGVTVPTGLDDVFVLLKKRVYSGGWTTWDGILWVLKGGNLLGAERGRDDYDLHFRGASSGFYVIKIGNLDYAGQGSIRVCGALDTAVMNQWKIGSILRPYGCDWKQLTITGSPQRLYLQTEGVGDFQFLDVYRDTLGSLHHWAFSSSHQGTISGQIDNPVAGTYYLKYRESGWLSDTSQVREYQVRASLDSVAPPPPRALTIDHLSTYRGGTAGPVTVAVYGTGFDSTTSVLLTRDTSSVAATAVNADSSGREVKARFDLSAATPGWWSLRAVNASGDTACAARPFVVESGGEQDVWVELAGREVLRAGRWTTYTVRFGNGGSVDAQSMLLWVDMPPGFRYATDLPLVQPDLEVLESHTLIVQVGFVASGVDGEFSLRILPAAGQYELNAGVIVTPHDSQPVWASVPFPREMPDRNPKPGEKVYRYFGTLTAGGDVAHDGIYVEDPPGVGWVVDLRGNNEVKRTEFEVWKIENGPSTYIGPAHPEGWNETIGLSIAGEANRRALDKETREYFLTPFWESVDNCHTWSDKFFISRNLLPGRKMWCEPPINQYMNWNRHAFGRTAQVFWEARFALFWVLWDKFVGWLRPQFSPMSTSPVRVVSSSSPEDKCGPVGYDPVGGSPDSLRRFVSGPDPFGYRIDFWNSESASAPAQNVFIRDTLNVDFADTSLSFIEVGFLRWHVPLLGGRYFNTYVDMRPDDSLIVNVEGQYDSTSREISIAYRSLDPVTMQTPEDPMAGFLPPLDSAGYNIGWANFSARPRTSYPTGKKITNQSWVKFDIGPWKPAPPGGPYLNTIDAGVPASFVRALPDTSYFGEFTVTWEGSDDSLGSGIGGYDIYARTDTGPYEAWLVGTTDTTAVFIGSNESRNYFYSIAADNVGWREEPPDSFDACTYVLGLAPPRYISPRTNIALTDTTPTFVWGTSAGSQGTYTLRYWSDSLFADEIESIPGLTDTSYTVPDSSALSDGIWHWQVEAVSRLGEHSGYRQAFTFELDTRDPGLPVLLEPEDGAVIGDTTPTFTWSSSEAGCSYYLQYASDSLFDTLKGVVPTEDTSYEVSDSFALDDGTYYWRVMALDRAGNCSGVQEHPFSLTISRDVLAISGTVAYYMGEQDSIQDAAIVLSGDMADTVWTDEDGFYQFVNLLRGGDYVVTPEKVNPRRQEAVSSYDAAKVLQHVVHIDTLSSLQCIAADVDGSDSVGVLDASQILQYAVGMRSHFDVGYRPGMDTLDWAFDPPQDSYRNLASDTVGNYLGILYGDPSGNWVPETTLAMPVADVGLSIESVFYTLNFPSEDPAVERMEPGAAPLQPGVPTPGTVSADEPQQSLGLATPGGGASSSSPAEQTVAATPASSDQSSRSSPTVSCFVRASDVVAGLSADMLVQYDTKRLRLVGLRTTEQTSGWLVAAADRAGDVRIAQAGTNGLSGTVELLELVFEPLDPALAPVSDEAAAAAANLHSGTGANAGQGVAAVLEQQQATSGLPVKVVWLVLNEGRSPAPEDQGAMGGEDELPSVFYLAPPRPNPFGTGTCISYGLPLATDVNLVVFDAAGRRVRKLVDLTQPAGTYRVTWRGRDDAGRRMANGVYFIRLQAADFEAERKVVLTGGRKER